MRLKILNNASGHSELVSCLGWSSGSELYTLGEDQKLLRWSHEGECLGPVPTNLFPSASATAAQGNAARVTIYYTALHWCPGKTDVFAAGTSDGKVMLCSKGARVDKVIEAHHGAILSLAWCNDGTALLSGGEDGIIKIWSKSGMLRSTFITQSSPVFSAAWSADGSQILFTTNRSLSVKPLQAGTKTNTWKAHEGVILKAVWNETTGLIVSGGEDKKYKVWDAFGRLLYSSQMLEHTITSLAWSINGESFAVGSFNNIRVCDRLGWTLAASSVEAGSLLNLSWMPDGTTLAFVSARGNVGFAHTVDRRVEWRNIEVDILDDKIVSIKDARTGHEEQLDFKDKLVHVGIAFSTVLLLTRTQGHVFNFGKSLNAFDLPSGITSGGRVVAVRQAKSHFATVDPLVGVTVFTYAGKPVCTIKLPRADTLHEGVLALNDELVAVRDPGNECAVLTFDVLSGKPINTYKHGHAVRQLDVDHVGLSKTLAIIDKNGDLHVAQLSRGTFVKLGGMADSMRFCEETPLLASVMDGRLTFWMYPGVVFVDSDLRLATRRVKDHVKSARIQWFAGSQCLLRRTDGSGMVVGWTCPFTRPLHELAARKKWDACVTLCRAAKAQDLWAVLAALALNGNELNTAEVAYAAIDDANKVQYMCYVRELKSTELRTAEMHVFKRQFKEAETILLSSGNPYLAIRMWINLHNWDRALDLATRYKDFLPVVAAKRADYLARMAVAERSKRFLQLAQAVQPDREQVQALVLAEERKAGIAAAR
ncbi:hypothetical protein H9P43_008147 [Blastocladiella emersonii ATCC 22665]|nr:hypothetical protein H9P43_008147 [Blastocladiella emersonii ATCC 22665]